MVALTWKAARAILRELLIAYLEGPFPDLTTATTTTPTTTAAKTEPSTSNSVLSKCMDFWFRNDLDLYGAALFLSVGLLVVTCWAWLTSSSVAL